MIKTLVLAILSLPSVALAGVLSDIDVAGIVKLADGVVKGEVISLTEMVECRASDECSNYRNVQVTVLTSDRGTARFRASLIDGAWRLDSAEQRRLTEFAELWRRMREHVGEKNDRKMSKGPES